MVDIYLEEIEPKVLALFKKAGREPTKRTVEYIERDDIRRDIERAKKERSFLSRRKNLRKRR